MSQHGAHPLLISSHPTTGSASLPEEVATMLSSQPALLKKLLELLTVCSNDAATTDDEEPECGTVLDPPPESSFARAVEMIRQMHQDGNCSSTMFWNVLDLRKPGVEPLPNNPRLSEFVEVNDNRGATSLVNRVRRIVEKAQHSISWSANAYIETV